MKLRIKGNSIRLRLGRSEVSRLNEGERIEESIRLAPAADAKLTYRLERAVDVERMTLRYEPTEFTVVVPQALVAVWATGEQVGLYDSVDLGAGEQLDLLVEKDFACLDVSDEENIDTFPNPIAGAVC